MRKGQAAMEFLMTYGWAILVVLVAIGALAYFGVLSPGRFLPESCTLAPGIGCSDFVITYAADGASTIRLIMMNGLGESLTNVDVAITGCTDDAKASGDDGDTWTDGSQLDITLTACAVGTVPSSSGRVNTDITLTYKGTSGISKTKTGKLAGKAV